MENIMDVSGCTICYETLGERNCCTTECGHKFCFKCIATAMQYNNSCPYCRTALIDEQVDDDDNENNDENGYITELGSEDEPEGSEDEPEPEAEVEDVVKRLQDKGVTMVDVLSLLIGRYSKNRDNNLNNDEQFESLHHLIWDIIVQVDDECVERNEMMKEDVNCLTILSPVCLPKTTK